MLQEWEHERLERCNRPIFNTAVVLREHFVQLAKQQDCQLTINQETQGTAPCGGIKPEGPGSLCALCVFVCSLINLI